MSTYNKAKDAPNFQLDQFIFTKLETVAGNILCKMTLVGQMECYLSYWKKLSDLL